MVAIIEVKGVLAAEMAVLEAMVAKEVMEAMVALPERQVPQAI